MEPTFETIQEAVQYAEEHCKQYVIHYVDGVYKVYENCDKIPHS